jgi:hypothetical protein
MNWSKKHPALIMPVGRATPPAINNLGPAREAPPTFGNLNTGSKAPATPHVHTLPADRRPMIRLMEKKLGYEREITAKYSRINRESFAL